jgi:hypothetical protein
VYADLSNLLAGSPDESNPHDGAHGCEERRPREDETWEFVPKPLASPQPTEENRDPFTSATTHRGRGRPGEVRPVGLRIAGPSSHARREGIERLDQTIELLCERLTQLAGRRGVDRVLRPPAQLCLRFGGLLLRYRAPERLLER